jgi:hypothetical protein
MPTRSFVTVDAVWPVIGPVLDAVSIGGATTLGSTLTCFAPGATFFQWLRNGVQIPLETANTHVIVAADQGQLMSCRAGRVSAELAIPAAVPPDPPPTIPNPMVLDGPWDLLPTGLRSLGVNIAPRNAPNPGPTFRPNCWAELWSQWEWSAPGSPGAPGNWIKPQIDQAKAMGLNTIHLIGSQGCRPGSGSSVTYTTDQVDTATYLAHWAEALSYIRSIGMYANVSFGGDTQMSDYGATYGFIPSAGWLQDEYALCVELWQHYQDIVLGVDLSTEASIWASNTSNSLPIYQAVKAQAPGLKYTWSKALGSAPVIGSTANIPPSNVLDYYDFHIYYNSNPADMDNVLAVRGLPVVIGEFGAPVSSGAANRTQFYNRVKAVDDYVDASGRRVAGVQAWCMYDQDTNPAFQYGLCTAAGVERSDVVPVLQTFPTS